MAQYLFTGGNGTTGETGLKVRTELNRMFGELYGATHVRAHAMDSASDHSAATGANRGKFVKSHESSGVMGFYSIVEADIPNTIARQSALTAHINNTNNPHAVTLPQIALSGAGIKFRIDLGTGKSYIDCYAKPYKGLKFNTADGSAQLDFSNCSTFPTGGLLASDTVIIRRPTGDLYIETTLGQLATYLDGGGGLPPSVVVYTVEETTGKVVSVSASKAGITASWANGNELTLEIPASAILLGMNIELTNYSTMTLYIHETDVRTRKWFPMIQSWRADTQNQNLAVVCAGDGADSTKFSISGLVNTTTNFIRLMF